MALSSEDGASGTAFTNTGAAFVEVAVPACELRALMAWLSVFDIHDDLGITFHFGPRRQMTLFAMDTLHISLFEAFIPFVEDSPLVAKDAFLRTLSEVHSRDDPKCTEFWISMPSKVTLSCRSADFMLKFNACVGSGGGDITQFRVPVKNWNATPLTLFHPRGSKDDQFAVELISTPALQVPALTGENATYVAVQRGPFTNALRSLVAIATDQDEMEITRLRITSEPHSYSINLALSKVEKGADGKNCSICASDRWHVPGAKRTMVCGVPDEFFVDASRDILVPRLVALDTHFPGGSVLLRLQPEYVMMFAYPLSDISSDELADAGLYAPESGGGWAEDDVPLPFPCVCLYVAPVML